MLENCNFVRRNGCIVCTKCGWWIAADKSPPGGFEKNCLGEHETRTALRGAGDVVEVFTSITRLSRLAELYKHATGRKCACKSLKAHLNRLFPFKRKGLNTLKDGTDDNPRR